MAKLKLSGAAVVLIIVVPLFMYTGALLIGVQLGRALERGPGGAGVIFSIRGALAYIAKELWDDVLGLGRGGGRDETVVAQVMELVPASRRRDESSAAVQSKAPPYVIPWVEGRHNSSAAPNAAHRYHTNRTSPMRGVISVGSWGASGGQAFYMRGPRAPRLRTIVLYHSTAIHSLACDYSLAGANNPTTRSAGPWGLPHSFGSRGVRATIKLCAGEHVTAVEGTTERFGSVPDAVVTSLTFRTSAGRVYGPYGNSNPETTTRFSVPAADGACIVGFWGRSGWLLDAIGVYIKPACSSSN